ncbi:MAG: hypothetical protein ACW97Z_09630 [Candidatus Hodarchaeales archaeon]
MGYKHNNQGDNSHFEMFDKSREATQEREASWFLGSLIQFNNRVPSHFYRMRNIHNCITHEETGCDNRFHANDNIASRLVEFFPLKWLDNITNTFKNTKANELGVRQDEDRLYAYLAYIDLLLMFRGLILLDSTLEEINNTLDMKLTKHKLRTWRLNLLKIYPDLRKKWRSVRAKSPSRALLSTTIRVMNTEMNFDSYSQREIFDIKHQTLQYAQQFAVMERVTRIKRMETWVRALCLKAIRDSDITYTNQIFPSLSLKEFDVLENKRWQLDKILQNPSLIISV